MDSLLAGVGLGLAFMALVMAMGVLADRAHRKRRTAWRTEANKIINARPSELVRTQGL